MDAHYARAHAGGVIFAEVMGTISKFKLSVGLMLVSGLFLFCHFYLRMKSLEFRDLFASYEFEQLPRETQLFFSTAKFYWLLSFVPLLGLVFAHFDKQRICNYLLIVSLLLIPALYQWAVFASYAPIARIGNMF